MNKRQLAGFGFLIGNAALFANGLIARNVEPSVEGRAAGSQRMLSAAAWSGAGLILAKYGQRPVNRQLERIEERLAAFLQKEGVPLDAESLKKANEETQRSWFGKLEDFLYDHPIECSNAYIGLAALGMLRSGTLKYRQGDRAGAMANLADGALVVLGALASILIPEKTPKQIAAAGQSGTLWGNIQKQPLEYLFYPHLLGDLAMTGQAWSEYKAAKSLPVGHDLKPWNYAMAGTTLLAVGGYVAENALTGFGSKKASGKASEHEAAQQQLLQDAAHMLSGLPSEKQRIMAEHVAGYLVLQPGLRLVDQDKCELAARLMRDMSVPSVPVQQDTEARPVIGAQTARIQRNVSQSHIPTAHIG